MTNVIGLNMIRSPKDKSGVDQDTEHFEEVCPVWFRKFRKGLDRRDKSVLARDSKYCLVGEAWGYAGKQAGYYMASSHSICRLLELCKIWTEIW